jgi:hypothetical protein
MAFHEINPGATVEPNRKTMRGHYRQLVQRVELDTLEIARLRRALEETREGFRQGLQELYEICLDKETPSQTRLLTIAAALKETLGV